MYTYGNLIAGKCVKGEGGAFETRNPARPGEVVGGYGAASSAQVGAAVAAARDAQSAWRRIPSVERGAIFGRFIAALEVKLEELARSITLEQGKPLAESRGEVAKSCGEARFMMGEAARGHSAVLPSARPGIRNMVVRRPRGVIAAITPWNYAAHREYTPFRPNEKYGRPGADEQAALSLMPVDFSLRGVANAPNRLLRRFLSTTIFEGVTSCSNGSTTRRRPRRFSRPWRSSKRRCAVAGWTIRCSSW